MGGKKWVDLVRQRWHYQMKPEFLNLIFHVFCKLLLVFVATFISCLFPSPLRASAMPDHVMSTLRSGCSSPSVCFGSCLVELGWALQRLCPHRAGKGMRRGEPMIEGIAHSSSGQLGWKKAQVLIRVGEGVGKRSRESIGFSGIYSITLQIHWLCWCHLHHVCFISPVQGVSKRALWSSYFKWGCILYAPYGDSLPPWAW